MAWKQLRLVPESFDGSLFPSTTTGTLKYNATVGSAIPSDTAIATVETALNISNLDNTRVVGWTGSTNITTVASTFAITSWQSTTSKSIATAYGGTGVTSLTAYGVVGTANTEQFGSIVPGAAKTIFSTTGSANSWTALALNNLTGKITAANGGGLPSSYSANNAIKCSSSTEYAVSTTLQTDIGLAVSGHNHTGVYLLRGATTLAYDLNMNANSLDLFAVEKVAFGSLGTSTYNGHLKIQAQGTSAFSTVHFNA